MIKYTIDNVEALAEYANDSLLLKRTVANEPVLIFKRISEDVVLPYNHWLHIDRENNYIVLTSDQYEELQSV